MTVWTIPAALYCQSIRRVCLDEDTEAVIQEEKAA